MIHVVDLDIDLNIDSIGKLLLIARDRIFPSARTSGSAVGGSKHTRPSSSGYSTSRSSSANYVSNNLISSGAGFGSQTSV
ncbi:unnamed protein product [Tilletia controversa]|uniref:Uncharacterized protein n=3 Tax=Tilletia TaxID=13289 RepID=A0A8X7MXC8_9BASI|nr:hypothetical protein CF336_g1581 [Tilletia laevis]KAE8203619.1 hypothetical protein CF328_g1552 [Tilletia controversa]KAE8262511.1 hypothetical protein A4X03_0g2394 [Tilletia caries]KAE8207783.1 hypothetical protein CF335_g893 [Tilletia laevis]KAE8252739.1 hypothetical protein A4X06_0g1965 [Tilletia controversa]